MFGLFKKKKEEVPKHYHGFSISLGKYYKLYRTTYRNCLDTIRIYERKQCECGYYNDICLSSNDFPPSMYEDDSDEKDFIKELKSKGIKEEYEINSETNMTSNRKDCW